MRRHGILGIREKIVLNGNERRRRKEVNTPGKKRGTLVSHERPCETKPTRGGKRIHFLEKETLLLSLKREGLPLHSLIERRYRALFFGRGVRNAQRGGGRLSSCIKKGLVYQEGKKGLLPPRMGRKKRG